MRCMLLLLVGVCLAAENYAAEAWPGFRGRGDSVAVAKNLPVTWEQRGQGGWTTRLAGYGQSSPVVWGQRVFVTSVSGDEKENLHVAAIDLATGKSLWRKEFSATQKVRDSDTVSRGAPTPAVDAERVYAIFESGDIVALSHGGELLWQRSFVKDYGEIKGPHGYASSPLLIEGLVIVQVCHTGASYLLALDAVTGANRWKTDHPAQTGWSSPVAYPHGQSTAVVVSTAGSVRAYDAIDGKELWYVTGVQGNSTASPTVVGDLIVIGASERGSSRRDSASRSSSVTNPNGANSDAAGLTPEATANQRRPEAAGDEKSIPGSLVIRTGGHGDVTQTHVVWRAPKVAVGYASPLAYDGLIYFTSKVGVVQCVDLKSGELRWQHRLPGQTWASAVANNGHLFFFCKDGEVMVLKAGAQLQVARENSISVTDIVYGVAAVDDAWIVRCGRSLVKIVAVKVSDAAQR